MWTQPDGPVGVCADKEIQRAEAQVNVPETPEPFDCEVPDQYRRRGISSSK